MSNKPRDCVVAEEIIPNYFGGIGRNCTKLIGTLICNKLSLKPYGSNINNW